MHPFGCRVAELPALVGTRPLSRVRARCEPRPGWSRCRHSPVEVSRPGTSSTSGRLRPTPPGSEVQPHRRRRVLVRAGTCGPRPASWRRRDRQPGRCRSRWPSVAAGAAARGSLEAATERTTARLGCVARCLRDRLNDGRRRHRIRRRGQRGRRSRDGRVSCRAPMVIARQGDCDRTTRFRPVVRAPVFSSGATRSPKGRGNRLDGLLVEPELGDGGQRRHCRRLQAAPRAGRSLGWPMRRRCSSAVVVIGRASDLALAPSGTSGSPIAVAAPRADPAGPPEPPDSPGVRSRAVVVGVFSVSIIAFLNSRRASPTDFWS